MQSNKIKTRFCVLAAGTAIISFAVPQAAQAASPPFAYTEEKWDSLRDNKLEYDEIGDLIHEYNSTVLSNQIAYEDYKGKDSDEVMIQPTKFTPALSIRIRTMPTTVQDWPRRRAASFRRSR